MGTPLDIRLLDPHDDAQLRRFHEIGWRAEMEDGRPWNDFWTYDELAGVLREPTADQRREGLCAFEDGEMVGGGFLQMPLLDNLDKAFAFALVEPEQRGRGIGGAVVETLVERASEAGRTMILSGSAVPYAERDTSPVLRFAEVRGFIPANLEVIRSLPMPLADGLLDEITRETVDHHGDYVLETYVDFLPEEYLLSYCYLLNQLAVDAPTGDIDFEAESLTPDVARQKMDRNKRMGRTTYLSIAVSGGEAVAHSDLFVLGSTTTAHQMGTLVRRDHRGHRLGTAVKVANLEALQQARPDVTEVHTQNAETNRWMVDINVRLGFEPVGIMPAFVRRV